MDTITVKAKKGTRCPKERKPREYITDSVPVEVPATGYYRKLLRDGSLESANKPVKAAVPTAAKAETTNTDKKKGGK